jgi:DNA-binding response OmpR family regulator
LRILLLEDEMDIAEAVVETLQRDRYDVVAVREAEAALARFSEVDFDLAVLDVMIDDDDDAGFDLAAELRDAGFVGPILFTTARDRVEDRVRGLDLGGDDYLIKPYSLAELSARIRALLRREAQIKRAEATFGALRIDLSLRRIWWEGMEVPLSDREFAMVEVLALHPQRTFSAVELLERFFPDASSGSGVVRVYVRQLRSKISPGIIATVPGGYRLGVA